MGGSQSQAESNAGKQTSTVPTVTCIPCHYPKKEVHLVLAFLSGILLTLLVMAIIFLIIKSYRKCHPSPQAPDPHSDSFAKFPSTPEEALNSVGTDFKISEEMGDHWNANHFTDSNSVVYAQIKLTNSP